MAKQYFQGNYGFKTITKKYPIFKSFENVLKKEKSNLYLETTDGKLANIPLIKTIADVKEYDRILKLLSSVRNVKFKEKSKGNEYDITLNNLTWRFYRSGGRLQNIFDEDGNAKTALKPKTEQQEDAIRYLLESAKLQTKENINKAIKFNFDKDWHNSFVRSFTGISKNILSLGEMKQYNFYRDSNKAKPKFLNQITDEKILPDSKDNWNPADIWCVKKSKEGSLAKETDKIYEKVLKSKDIETLNDFVFKKFQSKELIGISLKQVTTSNATVKKIQTDSKFINNLNYLGVLEKFLFKCSNTYFDILFKMKNFKEIINYRFRFRPRAASGQIKTFGEGQPVEQKTFDGAVSADVVTSLFVDVRQFENDVLKIKTMSNVLNTLKVSKLDKKFIDFVIKNNFKFVKVEELEDKLSDYEIKRAIVLLYYIYKFETYTNKPKMFKAFYLAAKKMNEYSSIHYKVF